MILPYGTRVNDCGHVSASKWNGGTGYANHADGTTVCYLCADEENKNEVRDLAPRTATALYLSSDRRYLTSWTGGRVLKVTNIWGSRISPSADGFRFNATDGFGRYYFGTTPGPGMYARVRRSVRQVICR